MKSVLNVRWVLAHEPIELFLRAANRFSDEVNARTNGRMQIEVMTLSQYSKKYNEGRKTSKQDLLDFMEAGKIEMSQMYTTTLGQFHKDMYALDLPFLFRDHEHAAKVLDGSIGRNLMANMSNASNIQGLAFTYSGGFRIIPSNRRLDTVEAFKGLKLRVSKSPVAFDTFKAIGAEPMPMELEDLNEGFRQGSIDAGESTYPRFYSMNQNESANVINDTQHSLFLTSILMSKPFWQSLDADLKTIVEQASMNCAVVERRESVDDIQNVKDRCAQEGVAVVTLSPAEQKKFSLLTHDIYSKYRDYFSPNLVDSIIAM